MKVQWLKEATASLDAEYEFLAARNPSAAKRVFKRIESSANRLHDFPLSGRRGHVPGTRELVVPGLPYAVIYRTTDTAVEILRLFHTSQDRSPFLS